MTGIQCRLMPFASAPGPQNMAADEVLLESALAGVASLRFYGWSGPTLSLGYFQAERSRRLDELLASLPFVRRATGGDALVHHHEVTYALALPAGSPWQSSQPWLLRMHEIIRQALQELGVMAPLRSPASDPPFTGVLCFQHITPGDLVIGSAKVVGSAQRRQRGALLQHGGILLARSPHAPELPGIRELSGKSPTEEEVANAVSEEFARQTNWPLVPAPWSDAEQQRIRQLVATKYMRETWNQKR
jgi:lipoate-protein ligase A